MPRALDPRFALEIAAMDDLGWIDRALARERTEGYARAAGLTYAEALHVIGRGAGAPMVRTPAAEAPTPTASVEPLLAADPHLSTVPPPAAKPRFVAVAVDVAAAIAAALAADPARTDRDIARELRCSPTTVGRARAAAGLMREVRQVRRGGADYPMRMRQGL